MTLPVRGGLMPFAVLAVTVMAVFALAALPAFADSPANPWAAVAPTASSGDDTDAFAGMDALQVAALPVAKRIAWRAPQGCVPGELKSVLAEVAKRYGPITVNSTARSKSSNTRAGGKSKSFHLNCRAIDFRVHGSTKGLLTWLAKHPRVGGYKRYSSGFYHIDNGPRRSW